MSESMNTNGYGKVGLPESKELFVNRGIVGGHAPMMKGCRKAAARIVVTMLRQFAPEP